MLKLRKNRKGFTLVELLVVVLILAILMAVALPLYLSSIKDASTKTCRANMQSIANAAQAWKVRTRASDFSSLTGAVSATTLSDLGAVPICPDKGAYTIGAGTITGGFKVSCGYAGHGSFEPGVDSQ